MRDCFVVPCSDVNSTTATESRPWMYVQSLFNARKVDRSVTNCFWTISSRIRGWKLTQRLTSL